MRALLPALLALTLSGCVPPAFSRLVREPPVVPPAAPRMAVPDVGPFRPYGPPALGPGSCPPVSDSTATRLVACLPDDFNAHVASREPAGVEVQTLSGRRVRGPSIWVRRDTAFLGERAVPMASVDGVWVEDRRSTAGRVRRIATSTLVPAVVGGALSTLGGLFDPERSAFEDAGGAAIGGATVGLVTGLLLDRVPRGEIFDVEGWHDPALAPGPPGLLAPGAEARDQQPSSYGVDCGRPAPPEAPWVGRCTTPGALAARAGAGWAERVEVYLRDGGHLSGRRLALTDSTLTLDGVRQPLASVLRVDLRVPGDRGPWDVARPALRGALEGAVYGLVLGAGARLAGSEDPFWSFPLVTGSVGFATGLTLGLVRTRDRARDVTWIAAPEPGP